MPNHIQDLAPLLAEHFVDIELAPTIYAANQALVVDHAQRLGRYNQYLGLLHDSWVLNINLTTDRFSILLNDFTTHVFSDELTDRKKLGIPHDLLVFPIQIDFEITSLSYNTVDETGQIKLILPVTVHEYLYEQVISINTDQIELGLVVWQNGIDEGPGRHILILLNAKNIILTELQKKAWTNIFGDAYDDYYQFFRDQFDTGRYLSDQSSCKALLDEFEALKMLRATGFDLNL